VRLASYMKQDPVCLMARLDTEYLLESIFYYFSRTTCTAMRHGATWDERLGDLL
jgi:hypothetical protein